MIRPLRVRHRIIFLTLAAALPVAYAAGLLSRRPIAIMPSLPAALSDSTESGASGDWIEGLWGDLPLNTRIVSGSDGARIVLAPRRPIKRPSLLLYWTPLSDLPRGQGFPSSSVLLGAFSGVRIQAFPSPDWGDRASGTLFLYSLAHREVVAAARLPTAGEEDR